MEHIVKVDPSSLRITDMRFTDIIGAPKRVTLVKILTNQGIEGYGEIRDGASKNYAMMLKSRIIGENPCNVDRIFNKIKQFEGHSRQGGGGKRHRDRFMGYCGESVGSSFISDVGR